MTEAEAQNKVCPIARMRASFDDNWDKGHCIASECMLWRWDVDRRGDYPEDAVEDGYCGLVGKP